ncbi:peroxiredoxin family protein [Colwellia sp. M166]|uniref:peroxiredoxin family protein n=1 Tax=Colwellia sp. M166 TaxID=2583805 RepID=UPI00211EC5C6|nr:peroxiredoxin family protein [Colwellia sp. M166]UUO22135.1 peroxiredoxin family protein [Colwellia sp. M166]|tara:strand:- start:32224 stop:33024 length:801 start_codon:yes stop_codon:yes gene_type:complete
MMISLLGFMLLNIALVHYFYKLKKNQTPKKAIFLIFSMLIGSLLSLSAIATAFTEPVSNLNLIVVVILALLIWSTSAIFSFFLATKATPIGEIKVSVGEQILPFTTANFDYASLMGKGILLKFYRGSWCPYCSAELIMFEQLKPKLAEYNIEIFAISNDSTAQQQAHCLRDNISHTLISDEDLAVIRQYGVEHHKALAATADDTINILGIAMPLPWKMKYRPMAIPTSLLIDETGNIIWIDQSADYRLRASEAALMSAVKNNFSMK